MLGKPIFKFGDIVTFNFGDIIKKGIIVIIDDYGTFEDNTDVSYDILIKEENNLYKHIREDFVIKKIDEVKDKTSIW